MVDLHNCKIARLDLHRILLAETKAIFQVTAFCLVNFFHFPIFEIVAYSAKEKVEG